MKKIGIALALAAAMAGAVIWPACTHSATGRSGPVSLSPAFSGEDLAARFAAYFEPVKVTVEPKVGPYDLPLKDGDVQNLDDVAAKLGLAPEAVARLRETGIVSVRFGAQDDIVKAYNAIKESNVPVFITSDSVLHLYHIQFDETLRAIEEREFIPDLIGLTKVFQSEMEARYEGASGLEKEAFKKGLAYFTVALKLQVPDAPAPAAVKDVVEWELDRIEKREGFPPAEEAAVKAVFTLPEDYSQYVPRGHYTRSEELKRYFKAMMWYGRLTMLIKGAAVYGPESHFAALVSVEEAQKQTILAAAVAGLMGDLKVGDRTAAKVWERLYTVTAYYVGLADDLGPQDYREALAKIFGNSFEPGALADPGNFQKLQAEIARLKPPAIYSGTGESSVDVAVEGPLDAKQLDKILGKTMGLRFMGQRYIPDSYMFVEMVAPSVGLLTGPPAFTTVPTDAGPVRGFPRGLDVMAVLGSDRALEIMAGLHDTGYVNYDVQMKKLRDEFNAISDKDWNRNLYWSWLYALKGLVTPVTGPGWPTFMTTAAWQDKELNAALGSWSSLRHDTILYAKQSYTPTITETSAPMEPRPTGPVVGYVEPVPEFYGRLVALTRMSLKGLGDLGVLDDESRGRLTATETVLSRLLALSEKELANEVLDDSDYAFIRDFGEELTRAVAGADAEGQKTTLIADVHTDQNSGMVLEEGTGYLRLLLAAYKMPQGHILAGAGPVFSYYEFKHPMSDRLTDEKWRELLSGGQAPALPEWTQTFAAP